MLKGNINITGIGVISPIGDNADLCFHSLINKQSGISKAVWLDTIHKETFPVGEVKHPNIELLDIAGLPQSWYIKHTRTSLLSLIATKEAIRSANLTQEELRLCAFISASSVGGMDKTENCWNNGNYHSNDYIYTHPCGDAADAVCENLGIKGYRTTISTACSSGANAIIHAAMLINSGMEQRVIVGGVDPLCKFTLNGFNSLMILDNDFCKPFDKNRNGLNLGEGAGYIVLESDESVKERNARVLCRLSGFANTNDAYHQTASSPTGEGAYLAMQQAVQFAGLSLSDINYINVHGTGTQNNDLSEGIAIVRLFGNNVPDFSSTKSMTGHALGGAAAIEAVFCILALINDTVLPQINFNESVEETNLSPVINAERKILKNVLSNSFGFGGNNSSLVFSKL